MTEPYASHNASGIELHAEETEKTKNLIAQAVKNHSPQ
jgi:pentose-5-phosphate-3-epimerase